MPSRPYIFIDTPTAWQDCLADLQGRPRFAIDFEANSLYAYRESICLIQISTEETDYIVDPLVGLNLEPLGDLIEDESVQKVLHSAEYDLFLCKRHHGWDMANLFDTAWAARILGYEKMGYGNVVEQVFGVKLAKKHQKANWCERPLSKDKLTYAQNDTHYLLSLCDKLAEALQEHGHWVEAQEIFAEQCQIEPPNTDFDPDGFWNIHGVRNMSPRQKAVMRALYLFRDEEAQKQDRPHFRIFGDKTMVAVVMEIGTSSSASTEDLARIKGMTHHQIKRYGKGILRVLQQGNRDPLPKRPPRTPRPTSNVAKRYEDLRQWRKKRAVARGVESDVIMPRQTLWEMANVNPSSLADLETIESLGDWRRKTYGAEIISVLNGR
jgi:ribonuclease D